MEIDEKLLEKLQNLALIEIKEGEKDKLKKDLQNILQFFDKINQLDLTNVEPLFHPLSSGKLRKDEPLKTLTRDEALQNVKRKENGYIVGPRTYGD
ncbi:Asp-tRNA(Asn) amidotransferase subunit GatC [Stygiolobus caldivivus]|uniref:Aspartyl/glutamyl-tRNA(Asn/Gln) amidotransferase subunit C n=1 Tax=Stygiolobus caldivivus TaxID=2824673 RepID=A0A8D5ZK84_9CREN|nr:Asp-tRNA(Asn) amidotransferase subunit GatC [Stygiolobus caldivivus]BCU71130.1 aspartyl/glutamyl-tRNA(Asn/Gln) amidotransferase subunit C [Stygiolobus caldivivus]